MGTNYYWRDKPCHHCDRFDEVHVGKSSGGWSFLFRAWPHQLMDPAWPDWGYDPASPFGHPVTSRADWRQIFTTRPGQLFDEYGKQIDDPIAWIDNLLTPDANQIAQEVAMSHTGGADWVRDPEGFRIETGEFS